MPFDPSAVLNTSVENAVALLLSSHWSMIADWLVPAASVLLMSMRTADRIVAFSKLNLPEPGSAFVVDELKTYGMPFAPVGPVAPSAPAAPAAPVGPVAPAAPAIPVGPVAPSAPAAPVGPVAP